MASNLISRVISIQVGMSKTLNHADGSWTTAFYKEPVAGPVRLIKTGLAADEQADTKHHGGRDKALLAYSIDHFDDWRAEMGREVSFGGFGENLSIERPTEETVCIGDQWSLGDVLLEISQPRQPCWKLGRRWDRRDLPKLVVQNGRSGWYFRVLVTGEVAPGRLCLESRPHAKWTVQRANKVFYGKDDGARKELTRIPTLADAWK